MGYTRDMLCQLLEEEGFQGKYNFVHLPVDFDSWQAFGYVFVNAVTNEMAVALKDHFTGFASWRCAPDSPNVCQVVWSYPHQGLEDFVTRYRNSPLMCGFVEEQYKPLLLTNGTRMPFPHPTRRVRAPKVRQASQYSKLRATLQS